MNIPRLLGVDVGAKVLLIQMELNEALNGTQETKQTSSILADTEEVIEGDDTEARCNICHKLFHYNPVNLKKHPNGGKKKNHRGQSSEASSELLPDPTKIAHAKGMVYGLLSRILDSLVNLENEHLKLSNAASEWARRDETLSDGARAALEDLSDQVLLFSANSLKQARDSSNISELEEQEWFRYKMNILKYLGQ